MKLVDALFVHQEAVIHGVREIKDFQPSSDSEHQLIPFAECYKKVPSPLGKKMGFNHAGGAAPGEAPFVEVCGYQMGFHVDSKPIYSPLSLGVVLFELPSVSLNPMDSDLVTVINHVLEESGIGEYVGEYVGGYLDVDPEGILMLTDGDVDTDPEIERHRKLYNKVMVPKMILAGVLASLGEVLLCRRRVNRDGGSSGGRPFLSRQNKSLSGFALGAVRNVVSRGARKP